MADGMGRRGVVWRTPDVTADGLKIFACIVMLIQNTGVAVVERGLIHVEQYTQESLSEAMAADEGLMTIAGIASVMELIGGMALPVFAFLLVEGFRNTSSWRNYVLRMGIFAVISELPYDLALRGEWFDFSSQNALFSMTLCLVMLRCLQTLRETLRKATALFEVVVVVCAVLWALLLQTQYGMWLVLLTAVFYIFYEKHVLKTVLGAVISLTYITGPLSFYGIWCYTGERKDRLPKSVYYIFYPVHLTVLAVIAALL